MKAAERIALGLVVLASQPALAWDYSENADQMRGGKTKFATTTSTNRATFAFPYNGGSSLDLTLRKGQKFGFNVMLTISKGQFSCFMDCSIHAKFDDGKVERWSAVGAANGSSDTIFINGEGKFLSKLRKAKQVIVEADFYNSGSQQFQFNVQGLKWD